jgi:hypothetical protein
MKLNGPLSAIGTAAIAAFLAFGPAQAQTNLAASKRKTTEAATIAVDKVVASPKKFKGTIDVAGRVGKVAFNNGLFALTCEDDCVSMPVKFSGSPPRVGTDVIVRGQVTKDAKGRYLFAAETVTPTK